MVLRINEVEIESHYVEYGAEVVPGTVIECDDEQDARAHAAVLGGKVLTRHVYETAWAEVAA